MHRRQFLAASTASVVAILSDSPAGAQSTAPVAARPFGLDSPPVLQCPTPDGVSIAWAVTGPCDGWVEYGPTEALGWKATSSFRGLLAYESRFHSVRVNGLKPGEPMFYRIVAAPVNFNGPYKLVRGEPVASKIYKYQPPTATADPATFAVLNDTHEQEPTLKALADQLAGSPADVTVWNGDVFNDIRTEDQLAKNVLRPAGAAYAAERPVLFVAGNHDHRGVSARSLAKAFVPWPDAPALPWNFAIRNGPIAMVGLDTGEDKPDSHPAWAGLAAFEPYRRAQRDWLAATLKRPDIASAPFLVVCCHIPLVGKPGENGGDTLKGYADYCKQAQELWQPLLAEARACVVISGHTHQYRYDAPAEGRPYGQLVGGGPKLEVATLIRGVAEGRQLRVTAASVDGKELGAWTYMARG